MLSRFAPRPSGNGAAKPNGASPPKPAAVPGTRTVASDPSGRYTELKVRLHRELLDMMNLAALDELDPTVIRHEVGTMVRELLQGDPVPLSFSEKEQLVEDVLHEILGLGPLEPLIKDPTVNDILVNTHNSVFVERKGRLELTQVRFKDDAHLLRIIHKIVAGIGRRIDESQPMVDARLPDGSRINAAISPIAVDGPLLSIRKFSKMPFDLGRLVEADALTEEIAAFLAAIVRCRLNILVSGGTGSGKTTMLNALSRNIGDTERIITIEDAAELRLQQRHVVRLETRPANIEGKGEIVQRDLVKNALRMRPDRIIVGEVRGGEAFDMMQAMNTGHDGSMTTIHANSCRDAVSRLEQMIGMSGLDLPTRTMRAQIASSLNVVVQLQRLSDGRRRLTSVHEITGLEGDVVSMQEIFQFQRLSTDENGNIKGEFRATGVRPRFAEQFASRGITLPPDVFSPDRRTATHT
ncbi:MAG: CpaF family protein [Alphaproteobacteria bacterium]